ncbi:hypothetical protein K432DRAFT_425521 [Lepidopterella palustris CBS 459.81]|uniref:Uncharacterized protein n=1 Tax=Lepidopterella palustris CBS 459.81 TaxID=1314670 RepID=A0A8E2EB30_9PEZI|nr:hypothetical protein K432DRAFT_425521 [Lepidopterella palustris CBS 459.81]
MAFSQLVTEEKLPCPHTGKHPLESSVPETIARPDEYDVALALGYGESKQVAERLLHLASLTGARANIFSVGQIAGPTQHPMASGREPSGFPAYASSSEDSTLKIFNLANPHMAPVSTVVFTIQKEYAIDAVPYETST